MGCSGVIASYIGSLIENLGVHSDQILTLNFDITLLFL